MNVPVDFWQLVGISVAGLLTLSGILVGAMKFGLGQAQKHQDAIHEQVLARLDTMEKSSKDDANQWQRVEREMLQLKADLPLHYVRREDYIRGQSVIEAKLDALASKLETAQLRALQGGNHVA